MATDNDYTLTSLYLFSDLYSCENTVFIQVDYAAAFDGQNAISSGIGLRRMPSNYSLGGNLFYQGVETEIGHLFQIIYGLELLTHFVDIHLNIYQPIRPDGIFSDPILFDGYIGDYSVEILQQDLIIPSCDFLVSKFFFYPDFVVRSDVGLYLLDFNKGRGSLGFQVREEIWWMSFVYAGLYYTYDRMFGSKTDAYIGISIPMRAGYVPSKALYKDPYCGVSTCLNNRYRRIHHLGGDFPIVCTRCHYKTHNF